MSQKSGLRIYDYIAADDPEAAERTVTLIYEKTQLLRNHPRLGYKYEPERSREVRILLYEHYRIAYLRKARRQHRNPRGFSWRFRHRPVFHIVAAADRYHAISSWFIGLGHEGRLVQRKTRLACEP